MGIFGFSFFYTDNGSSVNLCDIHQYFYCLFIYLFIRSQRKLSTAAQLAQTKEGNIDLETPDSILVNVNLKSLINVETFSALPPSYQHKLAQLLPRVDQIIAPDNSLKLVYILVHKN